MSELFAKKSLGQHFLRSEKALSKILESIVSVSTKKQLVFEIGPGEGVLTEKLLQKNFFVCVIEIDKRSVELLERKFQKEIQAEKLFILNKDCLEMNYQKEMKKISEFTGIAFEKYILMGNIPYYITGAIFRHGLEQVKIAEKIVFLIQKEVGERIVAKDNKESILSVSVKIFGQPRIVDIVKAGSFAPPPKVDSCILEINNLKNPFKSVKQREEFFEIIKFAFLHKRKIAIKNLQKYLDYEKYKKVLEFFTEEELLGSRAEDLKVDIWRKLVLE